MWNTQTKPIIQLGTTLPRVLNTAGRKQAAKPLGIGTKGKPWSIPHPARDQLWDDSSFPPHPLVSLSPYSLDGLPTDDQTVQGPNPGYVPLASTTGSFPQRTPTTPQVSPSRKSTSSIAATPPDTRQLSPQPTPPAPRLERVSTPANAFPLHHQSEVKYPGLINDSPLDILSITMEEDLYLSEDS